MDWTISDYVAAGTLVLMTMVFFALAAWKAPRHRAVIGAGLAAASAYVWLELAVGIFTGWGS